MLLNCGVGENSWESLGLQGDPASPFWRRSTLGFLCKKWCWSWSSSTLAPHAKSWLIGKDSNAGKECGQEEKGMTEDEMAGWHHQLDGCESEWTPGDGVGQGGLACCDSWGHRELATTEWLNCTQLRASFLFIPHIFRLLLCAGGWAVWHKVALGNSSILREISVQWGRRVWWTDE